MLCDSCHWEQICQLCSLSSPDSWHPHHTPSKGLKLYEEAMIKVAFKNPLGKRLTNSKFSLHGEGYVQDVTVDIGWEYNYPCVTIATNVLGGEPLNYEWIALVLIVPILDLKPTPAWIVLSIVAMYYTWSDMHARWALGTRVSSSWPLM